MKWGTMQDNEHAAQQVNGFFTRVIGSKAVYALAMLAAFLLMSGAGHKWTG